MEVNRHQANPAKPDLGSWCATPPHALLDETLGSPESQPRVTGAGSAFSAMRTHRRLGSLADVPRGSRSVSSPRGRGAPRHADLLHYAAKMAVVMKTCATRSERKPLDEFNKGTARR